MLPISNAAEALASIGRYTGDPTRDLPPATREAIRAKLPENLLSVFEGEDERDQSALAAMMWTKTRDTLLIVEPGTPAGYARIIALRTQLIALGAHVAAPCPHDGRCPLASGDGRRG